MKVMLVDRNPPMVRAWRTAFEDREDVTVFEDDYFAHPADAMVSPANSFGIMDGGLDLAIGDQRMALLHVLGPARIPSFSQIRATHHALRTA